MLLSYNELVELVDRGVIDSPRELINGASVDVRLDGMLLIERFNPNGRVIDLASKEAPEMSEHRMCSLGYALRPGEFVLASTIETFNLPDDIACEFKLKSSAARAGLNNMLATWCFTGDTKIPVLNGGSIAISDVSPSHYVYSINEDGEVVPGKVLRSFVSGYVKNTVKIFLDSGEFFECTPEHLVMTRDRSYKEATLLSSGDALMPLYRRIDSFGHEEVYCPSLVKKGVWKNPKGKWRKTHRVVFDSIFGSIKKGFVVHHLDHCKTNNDPSNLMLMSAIDHLIHHSPEAHEFSRSEEGRAFLQKKGSDTFKELWKNDEFRNKVIKNSSERISKMNFDRWSVPENRLLASKEAVDKDYAAALRKYQSENPGASRVNAVSGKFKKNIKRMIDAGLPIDERSYLEFKAQSSPSIKSINDVFGSFDDAVKEAGYMNHKVRSVEHVSRDNPIPVYDLTIDKYHNFAIDSGVFVHNCDPTWHGSKLTLELHNCNRFHPVLLRANMKIGQMIFYRCSSRVPYQNSYRVNGRYNDTTTVTASKGVDLA